MLPILQQTARHSAKQMFLLESRPLKILNRNTQSVTS